MTDDELKNLLEASAAETRRVIEERLTTIENRIDETRVNLEKRMDDTAADMRHQFDIAREATKHQVELLAESVLQGREEARRIEEKIESSAAETQAMIKFSHRELDRRVSALEEGHKTLEETVAELHTRVQRLESGTH